MSTATPAAPPVVYLGPSAPRDQIAAYLPDAVFRPPIQRGDLYRDRLLRFSVFLIIDGVFAQDQAIPPREVVDVLQDGGRVLGASSMGALRACDCHVAGAEGIGMIYRLFRRGVLNSEDEVAVTFSPVAAFPALTLSLANVRIALHRAWRAGRIAAERADRICTAAADLHYTDRIWPAIMSAAGAPPDPDLIRRLEAVDAKREDAVSAAAFIAARRVHAADWGHRPRRNPGGAIGAQGRDRERPFARDLTGPGEDRVPGFVVWLLATGRAAPWLAPGETALQTLIRIDAALPEGAVSLLYSPVPRAKAPRLLDALYSGLKERLRAADEFHAEWLRYQAARDAGLGQAPESASRSPDLSDAGLQLAARHGYDDWASTLAAAGSVRCVLEMVQIAIANGMEFRREHSRSAWLSDRNASQDRAGRGL